MILPNKSLRLLFFTLLIAFLFINRVWAFSFVVFGDNRDGDGVFKDLIKKVNAEKGIAFAVNTGDFVSNGKYEDYLNYLNLISSLEVKVYNVMGNHDAVGDG